LAIAKYFYGGGRGFKTRKGRTNSGMPNVLWGWKGGNDEGLERIEHLGGRKKEGKTECEDGE